MTDTYRVFVAVGVPTHVVSAIDEAVAPLRDRYQQLRWTRPDAWHVTLAFLGDVEAGRVEAVEAAVRTAVDDVATGPVAVRLGAPGHFNRRVLWLAVEDEPDGALASLGAAVQRRLVAAALPCDEKPVHPHVTLARTRGRERVPRGAQDDLPHVEGSWEVESVSVLRSHLGEGGSRYEELAGIPLAP